MRPAHRDCYGLRAQVDRLPAGNGNTAMLQLSEDKNGAHREAFPGQRFAEIGQTVSVRATTMWHYGEPDNNEGKIGGIRRIIGKETSRPGSGSVNHIVMRRSSKPGNHRTYEGPNALHLHI